MLKREREEKRQQMTAGWALSMRLEIRLILETLEKDNEIVLEVREEREIAR